MTTRPATQKGTPRGAYEVEARTVKGYTDCPMTDCLFCKIVRGQLPTEIVYQDDRATAFADITPMAPEHILVVPNKHIATLAEAADEDEALLGHLLLVAARLARERGITEQGFRTVINTNEDAGQTVFHIHVHVLGGRAMEWPPG